MEFGLQLEQERGGDRCSQHALGVPEASEVSQARSGCFLMFPGFAMSNVCTLGLPSSSYSTPGLMAALRAFSRFLCSVCTHNT